MRTLLTVNEFAMKMGSGRHFVYNLIKKGMPCIRVGKRYLRIDEQEAEEWLKRQSTAA